jgi:small ligand-binding sensory domain FIST
VVSGGETLVDVAQGCRPIGAPLTVTASRGNVVATLDGRSAFDAFAERARPLLADLRLAAQTVFMALPAGDGYVIRGLLGFEPDRGLLALSEPVPEGTRVQFALRESYAGRENLCEMVARLKDRLGARRPRFGLYFNCAGRGRALYGVEDHDIAYIQGSLGEFPLVGFFGGGELGPAARGRTRLHLFSGVLAVVA